MLGKIAKIGDPEPNMKAPKFRIGGANFQAYFAYG
jgi:hypothetical protein